MALVRTDDSEERIVPMINLTIGEIGATLAVTNYRVKSNNDDGGDTFLRNVGFYKSHTAQHPRRRHSS
jgi:hypothetical protein